MWVFKILIIYLLKKYLEILKFILTNYKFIFIYFGINAHCQF